MRPWSAVVINTDLRDPVHVQLSEQIAGLIDRGDLQAEMRLPPVRALARDLQIAPNTVVRAYTTLREAGLVVSDGRRRTKIAPRPASASESGRAAALRASVERLIEVLLFRGYTSRQIADALTACSERLGNA
jgi:GntR family transcriptional regulator